MSALIMESPKTEKWPIVIVIVSNPGNPDWYACIWDAKTLMMLKAIREVLIQNFYIHDTAEILSYQICTFVCYLDQQQFPVLVSSNA